MIALLALLAAAAPPQNAPPVFGTAVESVFLDVFVTQDGAPVVGLTAEDFEVYDNGSRQHVELVGLESIPLEFLLALDVSGSLEGSKLEHFRSASRAALASLRATDTAALLTFGQEVRLEVPPSTDPAALDAALSRVRAGGMTALYDAIYTALLLRGGPGRGIAIVFSDGEDNISWLSQKDVLRAAEESNVLLYVVSIDRRLSERAGRKHAVDLPEAPHVEALRRLAEATGGGVWLTPSLEGLGDAFRQVVETMKTRYVLRFEPPTVRAGRHKLKVRLRNKPGDVRARPSYFVLR